ncbi:MAG TPA: tetratricopeptide repeat protein [Candidatus Udaeobacter sp.]
MRLIWIVFFALALVPRGQCADAALSFLENRVRSDRDDFIAQNQLAARYLDLLSSTGDDAYLAKARRAAEASVASGVPELNNAGLAALARVQIASHQFAAARDTARGLRRLAPTKSFSFGILGDALLELGDYDEAAACFDQLAKAEPASIDSETRLARLALVRGELDRARQHFSNALTATKDLTLPIPQVLAWCCVQLGQLYFNRGDWENADKQYQAALAALPNYWSALEHVAELRAAQKKYPEAIALYEKVIGRVARPELCQALGDLYVFMGKPSEAKAWHDRAAAIYLKTAEQGDALYHHHLAGFYSDSVEKPDEALKWARLDLKNRHSIFAHDAVAWALYRDGQFIEAADEMKKALALGTKDSHLFFHASMIATASGDLAEGKTFLRRAAEVNPHYNDFHVHR